MGFGSLLCQLWVFNAREYSYPCEVIRNSVYARKLTQQTTTLFYCIFFQHSRMSGLQNSNFWATFRIHSFPEESSVTTAMSSLWEPHHCSISSFWIHFPLSRNYFRYLIILIHGTDGIYRADVHTSLHASRHLNMQSKKLCS